jgi:hypothetical protein
MEVRMQTRIGRSWTALRYDLSSQRALDNAARMKVEHDRLLAEIDALARRLDDAMAVDAAPEPAQAESSEAQRSRDVA